MMLPASDLYYLSQGSCYPGFNYHSYWFQVMCRNHNVIPLDITAWALAHTSAFIELLPFL